MNFEASLGLVRLVSPWLFPYVSVGFFLLFFFGYFFIYLFIYFWFVYLKENFDGWIYLGGTPYLDIKWKINNSYFKIRVEDSQSKSQVAKEKVSCLRRKKKGNTETPHRNLTFLFHQF